MSRQRRSPGGSPPSQQCHALRRQLISRLDKVMFVDQDRLRKKIHHARTEDDYRNIIPLVEAAEHRTEQRRSLIPPITHPTELPITSRLNDIRTALAHHQVVVVAGETGSGKTTQLPKLCLSLGWGIQGRIGHTQPRRIAARSVAERIANELGTGIGDIVGYTVRFTDKVSERTSVKVMTDGILLTEITRDRLLRAYDTIIIDEAHERSLNIDFLLGYLKQILPQRPDLHIIITSATIETDRFAQHFATNGVPAPIIEVSGRTYPVEIRYRPGTENSDPLDNVVEAVTELYTESHTDGGDILAFFPGEREIHEARDALNKHHFSNLEILPLFGRLSAAEQHRVFQPHTTQRIVLATNVAETSLTVPGIRYVIDTGTARISRYSPRTKHQRLPIEDISQASAQQRSGRCGRLSDGIAVRLYSEEDFASRPEYTDPEILRTNLAAVILRMADLGFGDIENFPFLDPPDLSAIRDGIQVLQELGALRNNMTLTTTGRTMARIPTDPRIARMLIEANRRHVLGDVLIIAAGLSLQDIRERPLDRQQDAQRLHARFTNPTSDFLSYLQLWDYLHEQQRTLSRSAFRKLCQREFLHWLRYREWCDLVGQFSEIFHDMGWSWEQHNTSGSVNEQDIHRALLSGVVSHVGSRIGDSRDYQGTRGKRFSLFPGSGISRKHEFVMAYEIVETSQVWGRTLAALQPEWVEKAAGDALNHSYSEPHWSREHGEVVAYDNTNLWGVPLIRERLVSYHSLDPELCRELFLLHGVVNGEWKHNYSFQQKNAATIQIVEAFEDKARQRGSVVDDEGLARLYDKVIPSDITKLTQFDQWWTKATRQQRSALEFSQSAVQAALSQGEDSSLFPDELYGFRLSYSFRPGAEDDGVTVHIPLATLPTVPHDTLSWLVPGLRHELVTTTLRGLPKVYRRQCIPIADTAADIVTLLPTQPTGSFSQALCAALLQARSCAVPEDVVQAVYLPPYLRMRFAIMDESGVTIDSHRNLDVLRERRAAQSARAVRQSFHRIERGPYPSWTEELGSIPGKVSLGDIVGYPALTATPQGFSVRVYSHVVEAQQAHLSAVVSLLMQELPPVRHHIFNGIPTNERLALRSYPGGEAGVAADCHHCALRDSVVLAGALPRTVESFTHLVEEARHKMTTRERTIALLASTAIAARFQLLSTIPEGPGVPDEIAHQVEWLTSPGFVTRHGAVRVKNIPRYLQAAQSRLDKAQYCDGQWTDAASAPVDALYRVEDALWEKCGDVSLDEPPQVKKLRWLVEEFKVSVFAQHLGTVEKVSEKRVLTSIAELP